MKPLFPRLILSVAEIVFIAISIILLPLWFPLLILWIVVDLPYHFALRKSARTNERLVRRTRAITPYQ